MFRLILTTIVALNCSIIFAEESNFINELLDSVQGQSETHAIFYHQGTDDSSEKKALESELTLKMSAYLNDKLSVELKPKLASDSVANSKNELHYKEDNLKRSRATLETATLTYTGDNTEFVVGKQIFSWGKGELYSPSDDLNPNDLLDIPNTKKLGVNALSGRYFADSYTLDAILIPSFVPNREPNETNRWARSTEPLALAASEQLGFVPTVNILSRSLPDDDMQFGARLTSSSWVDGWDFEISYFKGRENYAVYLQTLDIFNLNLTPVYPEYQEASVGFSTNWNDYEIHAEISWHDTDDQAQEEDYLSYVIGTRFSHYSPAWAPTVDQITYTFEYAGESSLTNKTTDSVYLNTGLGRSLDNSILTNVLVDFTTDYTFEIGSMINIHEGDYSFIAKGSYRPSDSLEFSIGFELFGGQENSFFGEWEKNDRLIAQMTYFF